MKWRRARKSTNVEDRRGRRVAAGGGLGLVGIAVVVVIGLLTIYIDLGFFEQMRTRLGGGGEFAEAYVIAHEVGHHIQRLTGVADQVNAARRSGENLEGASGLLVRQELQADCYSGVWGHHAQQRHAWLEPGDIEQALRTASAIGDDQLQRQSGGNVVPDSFTHGSSAQRMRWFKRGFETGEFASCDTFQADRL
ncbi:MAG: neutral zinc metallopeptidase [Xanthomonadaceae bacterium]|nr:neutral zinc metallopeptidase [Xanthomonadaceae bacterium]